MKRSGIVFLALFIIALMLTATVTFTSYSRKSQALQKVAGYGSCYNCNCKKFEGSGDLCSNCGHNYSRHW